MYSGSYFLSEQAMRGEGVSRGWRAAGAPTPRLPESTVPIPRREEACGQENEDAGI